MPETNMVLIWNRVILESSSCWKTLGLAAAEESALITFMRAAPPFNLNKPKRRFRVLGGNNGLRGPAGSSRAWHGPSTPHERHQGRELLLVGHLDQHDRASGGGRGALADRAEQQPGE